MAESAGQRGVKFAVIAVAAVTIGALIWRYKTKPEPEQPPPTPPPPIEKAPKNIQATVIKEVDSDCKLDYAIYNKEKLRDLLNELELEHQCNLADQYGNWRYQMEQEGRIIDKAFKEEVKKKVAV